MLRTFMLLNPVETGEQDLVIIGLASTQLRMNSACFIEVISLGCSLHVF